MPNGRFPCLILATVLASCGGEGPAAGGPDTAPEEVTAAIVSFTATPAEVKAGEPVELSWSVEGSGRLELELFGHGAVGAAGRIVVRPTKDTSYTLRLRAGQDTEIAATRVEVLPTILPGGAVIAAGMEQELTVAAASGPFAWKASGGELRESPWKDHVRWIAPREPGTYELEATAADGRTARQVVEVRELRSSVESFRGVGGQGSSPHAIVVSPAGDLYVATGSMVLRRDGGAGSWRTLGSNSPGNASLALAPDGTLWASGHEGLWRYDGQAERWAPEAGPGLEPLGDLFFGADGAAYGVGPGPTGGSVIWFRGPSSPGWEERAVVVDRYLVDLEAGAAGELFALTSGTAGFLLERLSATGHSWEVLGELGGSRALHLGGDGEVYVTGNGVRRWSPDGGLENLSEGLPTDCYDGQEQCAVFGLVVRPGKLLALDATGLHEREEGEVWVRTNDIPNSPSPFETLELAEDDSGDLVLRDPRGIWLLPSGADSWIQASAPGLPAGVAFTDLAYGPGGVAFAAATSAQAPFPAPVYRQETDGSWTALATELESGPYEGARRVAPQEDGSVLFAFHGKLFRVQAGEVPAQLVETPGLEGSVQWIQGAPGKPLLAGLDDGYAMLAPGASTWEELPPSGHVLYVEGGELLSWRSDGVFLLDEERKWMPVGSGLPQQWTSSAFRDGEGALWLSGDRGTFRYDGDRWERVGMGGCASSGGLIARTPAGAVFCRDWGRRLFELDATGAWVPVLDAPPSARQDTSFIVVAPDGGLHVVANGGILRAE